MIQNRKTGLTGSQQGQSTEGSVSNHRIHVAQALGNHRCDLLLTLARSANDGFQPSAGVFAAKRGFKPLRLNRANPLVSHLIDAHVSQCPNNKRCQLRDGDQWFQLIQ